MNHEIKKLLNSELIGVFATVQNIIAAREISHGSIHEKSDRYIAAGVDLKSDHMQTIVDKFRRAEALTPDDADEIIDLMSYLTFILARTGAHEKLPEYKPF